VNAELVHAPILVDVGQALVVLDEGRRLYAALSRDGSYWHVVQPGFELTDGDGNVVRAEGELVCSCKGGTFHGRCYRIDQAKAFEAGRADVVAWLPEPQAVAG
jgi:hypothetical protein